MIYHLTPEQEAKNKSTEKNATIFSLVMAVTAMGFFSLPSLSQGPQAYPKLLILWAVLLGLFGLVIFAARKNGQSKRVVQLETGDMALVLNSATRKEIIPYTSILRMGVHNDFVGNVMTIYLRTKVKPLILLYGFGEMTALADDLEKHISDPLLVDWKRGIPGAQRKFGGRIPIIGVGFAVLGTIVGLSYFLFKLGLGSLLIPISFIFMGISRFAMNRYDRGSRILGILFILGGIVYAVFQFLTP